MDKFLPCIEARIDAILISDDGDTITVKMTKAGKSFSLVLNEVDRFVANEFRQQNVIDRIVLWNSASDRDAFENAVSLLVANTTDKSAQKTFSAPMEKVEQAVLGGDKILLEVEPVFGASILALAGRYSLLPEE